METYLDKYRSQRQHEFPELQEKAIQHFARLGFPSSRSEEWKYTSIAPITGKDFSFALPSTPVTTEWVLEKFPFMKDAVLLVIENGRLNKNASLLNHIPTGIQIKPLSEAKHDPLVQAHYNQYADVQDDAFSALNTAFANEGIVMMVEKNAAVEQPVYIVHISSSTDQAAIANERLLVLAGRNSSAKISTVAVSKTGNAETFSNSIVEIFVDENAGLEYDLLQDENEKSFRISGTHVCQAASSRFTINTVALGGSILKNKLHLKLDGLNCETHMNGLYVSGGTQLIDNHTAVYHAKPHSTSNELYKGIIGGRSHGVFNGKIFVEKDAQKTNAYQSNKNILLSNDAVVNAKPQLEIFADDVKCTHGATTGQMDDESLFYLRSRGINEADAKALLNLAFANDILNAISADALREFISGLVETKLKSIT